MKAILKLMALAAILYTVCVLFAQHSHNSYVQIHDSNDNF